MSESDPPLVGSVVACDRCEMGAIEGGRHSSKSGLPAFVLCESCLDEEVRDDPRGVRKGTR